MSIPDPAKPDSLVGQLIDGRYRISREIAVGGMGVVYEAKHAKIGRSVAVKVLHREMAGDSEVVGRFLNEARAMGTIGHPNIVACTDFGELPGSLPYLVLEYLDGRTLGQEIATAGPLPVPRALRICVQVASALEAAHSRGVIHRDLTAGNVFLTKTDGDWDHAKVLDFGISKFLTVTDTSPKTRRGFTMGTPEYMAPEQVTHPDTVDARVDVYSLGVILYHMLAGKPPFGGVAVQTLFLQVVNELPPHIEREDIPAEVLALLDRALAKNPDDRFADMKDMGAELELLAPPPVLSGNYSGRIDLGGPSTTRPVTGIRPAPRTNTSSRPIVGSQSGVYAAASRTSLVEMAAKATNGEPPEAAGPSRRPVILAMIGLAIATAVVAAVVARRHGGEASKGALVAPTGAAVATGLAPAPAPVASTAPIAFQVVSATASARLTFRARVRPLPFSEPVAPDTKPELVEVTAPGREGKRFWLTMDHPMHLAVDLSPGRGVIEASTEETLVALGERALEIEPASPSSGGDSATGKRVGPGAHRQAPRGKPVVAALAAKNGALADRGAGAGADRGADKSGSSGSGVQPASTEAPAVSPPAASASSTTKPSPAPDPSVAAPPVPKAPAAEAAPPPVAAKPQPTPPARPSVTAAARPAPAAAPAAVAHGPVAGTVDAARAQDVFRDHNVDVQRCHQRAKIDNSDVKGRMTVRIGISSSGQVTATTIEGSSLHNHALESCIASAVQGWPFPPAVGGPATISHQFVLR